MALPLTARSGRRWIVGLGLLALGSLATGSPAAAQADAAEENAAAPSFLADLLGPAESFAPVEIELSGSLPRSGTFQGVELVVDRVHLTNTHPYTMFGEPRPGPFYYVVVEVTARNPTDTVNDYGFGDETFDFRTWSGRLLPDVPAPGRYAFDRLEPGAEVRDALVFGSEVPDILDGSALLVGRSPDAPLVIPLTAPPLAADYPMPVEPAVAGPYQAGAVAWSVLDASAGLDRPPGVCCPDTGSRADEGQAFMTVELLGQVSGSRYGQATVSSDAVRLVVDGRPVAPFGFEGQANVPEGETYTFAASWLVNEDDAGLTLQFLDGREAVVSVPLLVGEGAQPVAVPSTPEPSAAPSASATAEPSARLDAGPSAGVTAAPSAGVTAAPSAGVTATASATPRPVMAAIATLLVYSGRPDPDWALTADDLERLASIAAGLTPVDSAPAEGGLGYRGFRVTGPKGTWRASGGLVVTPDSLPGTSLADPDRLVERFLLESGRETLTAEATAIAQEALGPPSNSPPG